MADKNIVDKPNIWAQIDSHVASLVGQRVFYNHHGKKVLAWVLEAGYERDANGHIINTIEVHPPREQVFQTTSYLSSDRVEGSFDIAQPADLTDSQAMPQEAQVVETDEPQGTVGSNVNTTEPVPTHEIARTDATTGVTSGLTAKQIEKQKRKQQQQG